MKHILILITACFLIVSCASRIINEAENNQQLVTNTDKPTIIPFPFEIGDSVGRAIKYNLNQMYLATQEKLESFNWTETNEEKIEILGGIKNPKDIYQVYKNLSYAILIAQNNNQKYYDNIINNLLLAGVGSFNRASFATSKSNDLGRTEKYQDKILNKILEKEQRLAEISEKELQEKEDIEVFLFKAEKMQQNYQADLEFFKHLEFLNYGEMKFGSRKYFHLKTFGDTFNLSDFESLAVKNYVITDLAYHKNCLASKYPHAYRLNMNKFKYKNAFLQQEVLNEANNIIKEVLNGNVEIQTAQLLQIRLAYYIAKMMQYNYQDAVDKYKETLKDKSFNNKINIVEAKYDENNILGDYAIAVQSLYLLVDPISVPAEEINRSPEVLTLQIKKYFNQNLVSIIAAQKYPKVKEPKMPNVNPPKSWAVKGENWLEEVVGK